MKHKDTYTLTHTDRERDVVHPMIRGWLFVHCLSVSSSEWRGLSARLVETIAVHCYEQSGYQTLQQVDGWMDGWSA